MMRIRSERALRPAFVGVHLVSIVDQYMKLYLGAWGNTHIEESYVEFDFSIVARGAFRNPPEPKVCGNKGTGGDPSFENLWPEGERGGGGVGARSLREPEFTLPRRRFPELTLWRTF